MANKKKKTITDLVNEAIQKQETSQKKELAPVNLGNVAKSVNNTIQSTIAKSVGQPQKQNIPISPTISTSNVTKSILGVQQNTQNKMFNDITNTKTKQTVEAPIMTPEQIKSPANMVKQQRIVQKGIERARQEGGNTSLEGTTLNALKLYGQGMMKAEEGIFIDAPVSVASFIVNAGKKVGYGATKGLTTGVSFLTGIFDKDAGKKIKEIGNSYADSILLSGDAVENKLNKFVAKDLTGNALDYYGWNNKLSNGKTVEQQLEGDSAIKRESIPGQVIEGLGGMAPSILLGGIVSSGQTVTPQNINNIKKAQNLISYSSLGARSYGNAYEEAIQNGATTEQASAYGLSNAAVEIGTEWLSGGIPGVKGTAGGGLDRAFEKYILKEGIEETSKSLSKAIVKSIYKTSMEGVEEMISQTLEPFVKQFTYQYNKDEGFIGNLKEAASKVNLTDIVKAGIVGSLTAVALGDVDIKDIKAGYQNTQAINNVIQENIANQQQQLGRELTKEEIKQTKNVVHDDVNNLSQYGEQIANTMSNVRDYNLSSEGLDLEQSYKAYNGNKKYYNQIANIQKFMNNRNINARFDATMFSDNSQNAIWTTQDGKDTVVFNPKASQDQVIQNIATHEMTHDIINQKTEAGTSLFNDVLENIKTQENYAKDRQEIEDLYAKYYDRNSEDFAAKVDEEMVANELGKNLGTQEYINRLVNEKPNLARRIYNWVVDKLDNIGKSDEYKQQKAYWKSVADKFEVAYNEQKTATGEDKTAYSVKQSKTMLEKQFKELTGDSLLRAEGKLGLYAFQQMNNIEAEAPYNEEAMKLFNAIQNSKKTSSHLYHSTPTDRIQSIVQNGLQVGSKQNQEGVSSTNKLYLSATEDLASSFTPQDSVMLRISPNANLENLDNDLLGGEGSYTITNNIDSKYLQVKENGKWIPLLKSKYANQTKYSLTKDSQGRTLSKEQQKYFKDSKVVDENGDLLEVYHGTPNGGFTIFDKNAQSNVGMNLLGKGFYFTSLESTGKEYSKLYDEFDGSLDYTDNSKVYKSYLNIKNPFVFDASETTFKSALKEIGIDYNKNTIQNDLKKKGYDGIVENTEYNKFNQIVAFDSNQIKNIDNTTPTTNPDIRYSLTKDNTGRELSKGQREYFKDNSKELFDKEGNLKVAYHTTTNPTIQFNEFNPVGTDYYKFGEDVVNYYTDSKEMSGSYADQIYNMADTKRITSLQEAKDIVSKFDNDFSAGESGSNNIVLEQDGDTFKLVNNIYKYAYDYAKNVWENEFTPQEKQIEKDYEDLYKRYVESGYNNNLVPEFTSLENYAKDYANKIDEVKSKMSAEERNVFDELRRGNDGNFPDYIQTEPIIIGQYNNEQELFRNLKQDIQKANSDNLSKLQYEGYLHITNPFVVDAENRAWHSVENKDSYISNKINNFTDDTKNKLMKLARESETKYKIAQRDYENLTLKMEHLGSDVEIPLEVREMARVVKRRGTQDVESLIKGFNGYVNEYTLSELRREGLLTLDEYGDASYQGLSDELIDKFTKLLNQEVELNGEKTTIIKTAKQLSEATERAYKTYDTPFAYLDDYLYKDNNNELKLDTKDRQDIEELITDYEKGGSMIFTSAKNDFDRQQVKKFFGDNTSTNAIVKRILESNKKGTTNYDGIIMKNVVDYGGYSKNHDAHDIYVTFNSNQFKAVDNLNPTEDVDIRYSMQQEETPFTDGTRTTMGELFNRVDENIAPIREDLSNITKQMDNLSNQIETLQNGFENVQQGYVETYKEGRYENQDYASMSEEDANMLQESLMNDEGYIRSLEEQANTNNTNEKLVSNLVKDMQNRFDVTKENKPKMEALIREAIENDLTTEEIADRLGKDFSYIKDTYKNEEIKDVKKAIKDFHIKVDDTIKMDIADYGDFQRRNFGKISFSKNGLGVDSVYQELNAEMPGYFPSNIVNPTDQLLRIAEVANTPYITTYETLLDSDYIDDAADYIRDAIDNDIYNTQMESQANLDKNIQFGFNDEILPTTIRTQESIDEYIDNRDIAPISQEQMQRNQQAPVKDRANNMIGKALQMLENRNYEMDTLAKVTGNNEIKYAGDNWNNASSEANFNINNYQTDINGKWVGDSLTTIFNEMEQQGLGLVANDYLFQKSNIERHNVGKGSEVPLAVSQQLVAKYEMEHPELKKWSKKVYKLIDNYTKEQLASGLISKEKYDSYRGEYGIYGDYVPFYSAVIDKSRYFDNDGELKSVSTFKKSKGGSSDVSQLMTMKDAIANQIFRTKEAVRKNELFKEIVQQYQKYDDMLDMDMRNDPTNLDDSLFTTPEGDKVLSAYIDGKKVSAIISDELYNELSRENENRIQQMEKDFSLITKPLQKASDIRRKLVTTWNITFLARNMIKDVQDAVINSKHTTDMLANYFGTKKGSKAAIFELAQAKTTEAQQFLALYGADNLYGDYSNVKSKFSLGKANELIELAPRFAEFKATLQNGGSINEAIYNAREVTVNFGRGGYITKALNRNGFTFLNANVQGLSKAIRNLTGQNGVKGVVGTVIKGMLFAVAPAILNDLLFGSGDDKDEEYEALPDYIKDNYYLIKLENGKFLRIPKGRINSVFGSGARRMLEFAGGDKEAFDGYLTNAWSQIGIGDLTSNNVFAPLKQAQLFNDKKNGEAWYGGDIVPKRLQDSPNAEQTDASIDALSNFIGETFNLSPYKVNYVLDQYTGGFGDILLPMITPETTSGAETPLEYLTAPIKDAFVVNSIDDNKYAGEFYTKKEELTKKGKSMYATDEDKLRSKYMDSISSQMSELYKEKREVQADTTISNSYKYEKVQKIQNEINNLAKEGLSNYESFSKTDTYSQIGDTEYYKNNEGKWTKVNESDAEFTAGLNETEKTAYYNVKNKVSELESEYKDKVKDLSKNSKLRDKYSLEKKYNTIQAIKNSGLDNQTKAMIYGKYYSTPEKMRNVANAGYDVDTYMTALYDIETIRDKYSKDKGYSTAYRKKKTLAYINSLNMNIPQKAMLVRQYYSSFRQYNNQIVNYVGNLDIAREEKVSILEDMGMKVKGNRVTWK